MIIVTGGAGFIGANIVKVLNAKGIDDILVVDHLKNGHKFNNLVNYRIADYQDKDEFLNNIRTKKISPSKIEAIFHQGACSTTTEWDGKYMMQNNYTYSKILLDFCITERIPFIYASSAAVYGKGRTFKESLQYERPINVYGYSKFQFDQYVRHILNQRKTAKNHVEPSQIVGLRYFNVYGPHEFHKGQMASVAFHHWQQFKENKVIKLFGDYDGVKAGQQSRDFIHVDDVVNVNLWFMDNPHISGIFNCGTGQAAPFNDIAESVLNYFQDGELQYIEFPEHLKGHYQSYTQADIGNLRSHLPFDFACKDVKTGVTEYINWLENLH